MDRRTEQIEPQECDHPLLHVYNLLSRVLVCSDVRILCRILLSVVLFALFIKHISNFHCGHAYKLKLVLLNFHT